MDIRVELKQHAGEVEKALVMLEDQQVVRRIWRKDHTVWKPDPEEITNRLGWLTVTDTMRKQLSDLESFSEDIREEGFRFVVLLGMGGSSLGPEVLRQVFGKVDACPELIVLDSIDPDWIKQVQDRIDPAHTLFLFSSKSGTTIEPNILFEYFKTQVESVVGVGQAGRHFVAITDSGTALVKRAREEGFRRVFENPADIGGRYSILSFFGLVPGVLAGVDIKKLLETADRMKDACAASSARENPGCLLGAVMGALALKGRDKLTLITSPGVSRFGLWVEQLIAESTGKEGKGIIPVTGEPLVASRYYGEDRLFVFLRLKGDDNTKVDAAVRDITDSGQPVVIVEMQDRYDLGAEFFRWEFAVPVAGSILGINPFDQPDVQKAKDATSKVIKIHAETGSFTQVEAEHSLEQLLAKASDGKYLSIMAYVVESTETDKLIADFRRKVIEKYGIATTFGYGPRFLHSTGQLHKGGSGNGLSLQLTVDHTHDVPIAGKPYTFGMLTNAQAMGDLEVLQQLGRDVISIHSPNGDFAVARELADKLE
jgi:glucose-6-phosphate isomerase/transaldolase/glucose-6-phosphate isomerase